MASRQIQYKDQKYSLSYEIFNQEKDKTILFLHGWGSNKEIMKQAFLKDLNDFKHIYLDLPGFGNSSLDCVIDTNDYANIVKVFLNSLHVKVNTVVGHSFGGKVATLLSPENLVLLSSAGIVVPKSLKIRTKIKLFKLFKNIVPKNMYKFFISDDVKGMNQMMYEVLKKVVDEDFSPMFKKTTS
jgi:alpha-beta hydrolase superfamily lysophospholipase